MEKRLNGINQNSDNSSDDDANSKAEIIEEQEDAREDILVLRTRSLY